MKVLNLGCGVKTSDLDGVINIDWSFYLRLRSKKIIQPLIPFVLKGERIEKYKSVPKNIMVHNLAKGIPFADNSVDVVYHSHLFEHLDRDIAENFLLEVKRVLKPGGIHRISIPDLEKMCREYLDHIESCEVNSDEIYNHDAYIATIIEQSVRREGFGARQQKPIIKFLENILIGDARRRGETHQWMYDRMNLTAKLQRAGYKEVTIQQYDTSLVSDWNLYKLDINADGTQYKTDSLYIEAVK